MRTSLVLLSAVVLTLGLGAPLAGQAAAGPAKPSAGQGSTPGNSDSADVLKRSVALDLRDVTLEEALGEIDRQARLGLSYSQQIVPVARKVSITLRGTAREALRRVLTDTDVEAVTTPDGAVVLRRKPRPAQSAAPASSGGTILGQVTDSASQPLADVEVLLQGTTRRFITNQAGYFIFPHLEAGSYTLLARLVGYQPATREVTVTDSATTRVDIALRSAATRLTEVVTTATGQRRRLELGNDITVIRADSIVATQPVTSVTDLLESRVPGLVVQRTSGAPGDPARIRLRGDGSPNLSNDPIVIVDGIRVYAKQSDNRGQNLAAVGATNYAVPSPLDYVDPHSIETIEVIKGPSAATLYGQDAANGVIVITTKKGKSGPARWTLSAEQGRTEMVGSYPDLRFRWGHEFSQSTPVFCPINNRSNGVADAPVCVADSMAAFQLLSDPTLSVLDRGHRGNLTLGVSGGSDAVTYNVTGSYQNEMGLVRLPDYELNRFLEQRGQAAPDWMRRPQHLTQWNATSRLAARLSRTADVSLVTTLSRTSQQRSSLEQQLGYLMGTYLDRTTGTYYQRDLASGIVGPVAEDLVLSGYYERATSAATEFTNGVSLNWRPLSWFTATADAGLNIIQRADEIFTPRGFGIDSSGSLEMANGTSYVTTVNLRARAEAPLSGSLRFQVAAGVNYTGESIRDLEGRATNLAEGTESLNQAGTITNLRQTQNSQATFGWYVEPGISHKRFWLSTGFRMDGGSTFGSSRTVPLFPKVSASYLLSDEPFFPAALRSVFNTLRLRAAYGHAGRQPGPTDRLRLYGATQSVWADGGLVDGVLLQTLGNPDLKPERTKELEGGFDIDALDDRVRLSVTGYRKTTTDALFLMPVAPSVYGADASIFANIGVVRNTGLEASLDLQPIRSDPLTWGLQVSFSQNRNEVVELGPGVEPFYTERNATGGVRVAPGYPLFGRWNKPILGYADANGDGVLEPNEIVLGDTAVYMGSTLPKYGVNLHSTFSLFRGALSISAGLFYEDGLTQFNNPAQGLAPFTAGWNEPGSPLGEQLAVVDVSGYSQIQTVSTLRFNDLALQYNVPAAFARRLFGAQALSVSVQGSNLGLWTNYRGLDPQVNARVAGNDVQDFGVLPRPRTWQVRVNATY